MSGKVERARELRRDGSRAERICWELLRAKRLSGIKFRRQHSIGPYFADFACVSNGSSSRSTANIMPIKSMLMPVELC
jgi:very-short-patch-repair endonuclease